MDNLKDFIIEDKLLKKYIGEDAYVIVPDCVIEISDKAFAFKKNLTKVDLPESVKVIAKEAFYDCKNLTH